MKKTEENNPTQDAELPQDKLNAVEQLVSEVRNSNTLVAETAKECIDFIQAAERGVDYINDHSGFFGRIGGAISGKTNQIKLKTNQDLVNAQNCCVLIINEMNKQMLITQEQILMLENLANYIIAEENTFRKELQKKLQNIFASVKKRFEMIESTIYEISLREANLSKRVDKIEVVLGNELSHLWNKSSFLENYIMKVERQIETLEWITLIKAYDNVFDKLSENRLLLFLKLCQISIYTKKDFFRIKTFGFFLLLYESWDLRLKKILLWIHSLMNILKLAMI